MPRTARAAHFLGSAALAAALALSVAGCKTTQDDITGSLAAAPAAAPAQPTTDADWRRAEEVWGSRYRANPGDGVAAMGYARALRATGQRAQAVAVLEQATMRNPRDMKLLGAFGLALADAGQYAQALDALSRAHTPDNPDWRILNAQGAVLDQMTRHADAQRHYEAALKINPNEPAILSNLGLSYALVRDLKRAEETLRLAAAQPNAGPKVRQNLALVIGLQGRFAEAEQIASADLPPDEAAANVAVLRQMIAQQGGPVSKGSKRGKTLVPPPDAGS